MRNLKAVFKLRPWLVWVLRIVVGATFIVSGLAKNIDIWGFAYKIEEYFIVWGFDLPHTLYVIAAMALSTAELVLGAMLLLGCYKRTSAWLLLAIMCGMLPLSLYIYMVSPVADCGCFGDFLIISNGSTFLKNIFLTLALIYLSVFNRKVPGLYDPYWQWIVATLCFVFSVAVSLWGYNVQPLIDFRSFPVGTELIADEEKEDDVAFEFVYEKNGVVETFSEDNLPDSTWTFVDRRLISGEINDATMLALMTPDGEDATDEAIAKVGPQLIVTVPDARQAGISYTYAVNELSRTMDSIGGSLIEVVTLPEDEIERWKDLSNVSYEIYRADPIVLKELVRGVMGAVLIQDGIIVWKRTLSSIDLEKVSAIVAQTGSLDSLAIDGGKMLLTWSGLLVALLAVVLMVEKSFMMLKRRRNQKK